MSGELLGRVTSTSRLALLAIAGIASAAAPIRVQAQSVLFYDDFDGPALNPAFQASLPSGVPGASGGSGMTFLGAPNYSFGELDGVTVLRMKSTLNNVQRRGWSTTTAFSATDFRLETRFNVLVQSPTTSIDSFIEAWIIDAANMNRISVAGPHGGSYGFNRMFLAGGATGGAYLGSPATFYSYADNAWYRLVIQGSTQQNIRASLFADDGVTELVGKTLPFNASNFSNGLRIGLSQGMGFPNGPFPAEVAIDYVRLTTAVPEPGAAALTVTALLLCVRRQRGRNSVFVEN